MNESGSMPDEELQLLQVKARQLTALDLKKQALDAKQNDKREEALALLKKAKSIEEEEDDDDDEMPFSGTLPLFWKKVAILCKQAGDLDRAKQALMHSKELESSSQTDEVLLPQEEEEEEEEPPMTEDLPPPSYDKFQEFNPPPNYDGLSGNNNSGSSCSDASMNGEMPLHENSTDMVFTDEELRDEEMMKEFMLGGAKGIPSQEEYAAKVLSYKKLALKYKQEGDIPKASQTLKIAKQFEKVALALRTIEEESDPHETTLDKLNPDEAELLGELMETPPAFEENNTAATSVGGTDRLTIDDLQDMDDDNDILALVEMMGPDALPTVDEISAQSAKHKQQAIQYKQEGNIERAKSSLLQSKKATLLATRLEGIYRKLKNPNQEETSVSMEALEALVDAPKAPKSKASIKAPPKDPWLLKPSRDIKAEVIRLKNEKQVNEATRLLKLYKEKLALEQKEAEAKKCAKLLDTIEKRVTVCDTQRKLWQFYHWFGMESSVGREQYQEWTRFENECKKAIHKIQTEGSNSIQMGPREYDKSAESKGPKKLYLLEDDVPSLVESCTHSIPNKPTGDAEDSVLPKNHIPLNSLELNVMGLFDMDRNEKLQKILSKQPKANKALLLCPDLRINAKLQLPINPDDQSKPVLMDFEPTTLSLSRDASGPANALKFKYDFLPSSKACRKHVVLPRKDPKHERMILRRMETKTAQFNVYYLHNQQKRQEMEAAQKETAQKKSSWLFGRRGNEPEKDEENDGDSKDLFLGKVTIELKQLLSRGCIAGDFPIMVNQKEIGGILRVCLRTRPVLDPDRYEGFPLVAAEGESMSPPIKSYKKGIAFTFPKNDEEEHSSIEAIKQEG